MPEETMSGRLPPFIPTSGRVLIYSTMAELIKGGLNISQAAELLARRYEQSKASTFHAALMALSARTAVEGGEPCSLLTLASAAFPSMHPEEEAVLQSVSSHASPDNISSAFKAAACLVELREGRASNMAH